MNKVLVTGAAGFIGFHVVTRLIKEGYEVAGLDNINDYYDVNLKYERLKETGIAKGHFEYGRSVKSSKHSNYTFFRVNIEDTNTIEILFNKEKFEYVIHLAAQVGVRYSVVNPHTYIDNNIKGFLNLLEACRHHPVKHLIYASSSSVYGANDKMPFSENDNVDHPVSLYAATKKANELMAHSYSHLFNIPTTGLRFFTVYGPWGRPDMAPILFVKAILEEKTIQVFNNGNMLRDFTYIDDIVEGIYKIMFKPASPDPLYNSQTPNPSTSYTNYRIFNIGNNKPIYLLDFIKIIETALGKKAIKQLMPFQAGDIRSTQADIKALETYISYRPVINIEEGIRRFVSWYRGFYSI